MAHVIQLGYSNTSGQSPNTLAGGEVGVNTSNRKVWVGNGTSNTLVFNHADYASSGHDHTGVYATSGHSHSVTAGQFSQQNFTTTLKNKLDGIAASATNTSAPYYTSAIGVGAGGLTQQNFTTTLKNKLDGITAGANVNTHRAISDSVSETSSTISASKTAVKAAYDRTWPNTQLSTAAVRGKISASGNSQYNATTGVITSTNTTYTLASLGGITAAYAEGLISDVIDSAPAALNTLNELAASLGDDANYAATITTALAGKSGTGHSHSVTDGQFSQNNFTNADHTKLNGIAASATNTAAPYYTSAIAEGDHGRTQANFTDVLRTKLNGIAAGAQVNTAHVTNNNQLTNGAGYITSYVNTTYSEGDHGLTQANFTDVLRTKLNGIATNANNFTYSFPYTVSASESASTVAQRNVHGYFHASYFNGSGTFSTSGANSGMARFTGTNGSDTYGRSYSATGARALLNVADGATNTSAPYYTSAIGVGAGGLTQQNFTTALKNKLDGIAAGANVNTAHITNNNQLTNGAGYITSYVNTTYAEGDHGLTQANFTDALRTKLNGIATGANVNTAHVTNNNQLTNGAGYTNNTVANAALPKAGGTMTGNTVVNNYGIGQVGVYSATKYQHVWSMGSAYLLAANGSTAGTLYGIAYSHTNMGGQTKAGLAHQALFMLNGTTKTAIGSGIWTSGVITGTSNLVLSGTATWSGGGSANANTAYGWGNHASGGYYAASNPSGYITSYVNTTYSEGDHGLTQANFTDVLRTKLNGIAASATNTAAPYYTSAIAEGDHGRTQANFTDVLRTKLNGIATGANVNTTQITNNNQLTNGAGYITSYVNTTYSEGDHGLTQANFTDVLRTKLNGIATSANNYSFPYTVSASAGGSTIVQRNASGYIFNNYINTTDNVDTSLGWLVGKHSNGDNYHRSYTAATVRSFLGVAASANNYSHPTGAGNNHIPAGGAAGKFLKYSSSGVAVWDWDNSGVFSLTCGNGLSGGTITTLGTVSVNFSSSVSSTSTIVAANSAAVKTAYDRSWPNTTYSEGDHGLTQANFTDTLRTKLNGIAAGAQVNTAHTTTWNGLQNVSALSALP
jgi:uncharacterized protein YijF (DUF1287 family)